MDETNPNLINRITGWWAHPFNTQGNALQWVLFVGLVIIAAFLWQTILLMIIRETEA